MNKKLTKLEDLQEPTFDNIHKALPPTSFIWSLTSEDIMALTTLFGRRPTRKELIDLEEGRGMGRQGYKEMV